MDIVEYIKEMTPEQFENVCVKLLRKMKPKPFIITGTRYVKDGGKDIKGTVNGVPYEIWAECKKHSRSLGLDDISKNIVLVISNRIKELFFFSTSNITENAQRNISIVADKHDIAVAFHYGKELFDKIQLLYEPENNNYVLYNGENLAIEYYLTSYKNAEKYKKLDKLILNRDNFFYIDIFLHNKSAIEIEDINIICESNYGIQVKICDSNKQFNLQPYTDKFIQICGEILNSKHIQRIPPIIIEYTISNKKEKRTINCGLVDARQMIYFPLIGEKPNKFLIHKIKPILSSDNIDSFIIDIKGKSGNGKSRIQKEICSIGKNNDYRIISYDGMKNKDISIIKDLICKLLYVPYNKGNITFSANNILNILMQKGSNSEFAEAIYSFVFKSENEDETIYFVKQAVLNFLIHPIFEEKYILVFDNIQVFNKEMIDMLNFLISGIYEHTVNCIIVISTNIEFIPEGNKEQLTDFFTAIDSYPDDFHILYICDELSKDDAKSLYIHALNTDSKYFVDKLINKSGCRPFDIIMLIKYLQEEEIITWQCMSVWYISDFAKLENFLSDVPKSCSKIIENRLKKQSENQKDNYWNTFIFLIKSLLYFNGFLPIQFIEDMGIKDEVIDEITHSLFVKYDEYSPAILFFHDNIYRFFCKKRNFCVDTHIAKQIKKWFEKNSEFNIEGKDSILYKIYIDLFEIEYAKKYGIKAVRNNYLLKNYEEVSFIGRQLIFNKNITLSKQERFEIMYIISNSEREKVNHEKGADLFYETFLFLNENISSITITNSDYNKFMHACANSQLNASRPDTALTILNKFETSSTLDDFYKFIIQNRYSVVYLALGDITNARLKIENTINLAKNMTDNRLLSISYSDMAFIYFNAYENKQNTIYYFNKAVEYGLSSNDLNRNAELFQQKALCLCLDNNVMEALNTVNKSIELGEQIRNTFLVIKATILKSTIYAYNQNYTNAIDTLNKIIIKCDESFSLVGKIKAYTNMAAIYLIKNDIKISQEYINVAFNLFEKSNLSVVKHKPLFYNYITLYSKVQKYDELYEIIAKYNNEMLLKYLDDMYYNHIDNLYAYGVLRLKEAVFNY